MNDYTFTFKCPKCGWLYHSSEPIAQLDCLGCDARVITMEREKPKLKVVQPSNDLMSEVARVVKTLVDKCGLTAAQVTTELEREGLLPNGWTVVEVSNHI